MSRTSRKTSSGNDVRLYMEVLQNGETIDRLVQPSNQRGKIHISAREQTELTVPLYPLLSTQLIYRRKSSNCAEITVPEGWGGFLSSAGKVHKLAKTKGHTQTFTVGLGDYGALEFQDLTVVFKIKSERLTLDRKVKRDPRYKGAVTDLLIRSQAEFGTLLLALLASLIVWGGFTGGLLIRPNNLPKTYADLSPEYALPFLSAEHLLTIPEANQRNLNREMYIKSTMDYYRAFSRMILGYDVEKEHLLFDSSMSAFRSYYNDQMDRIQSTLRDQLAIDQDASTEPAVALIRLPTIKGSAVSQDLTRLIRTLDQYHDTLETNLRERRLFKKEFLTDETYKMTLHDNIAPPSKGPSAADISFKGTADDETVMYETARDLANRAKKAREFIEGRRSTISLPTEDLLPAVAVKGSSRLVSFTPPESFDSDSQKLETIIASQFGGRKKSQRKIQEPLTGQLDPKLVSQTIDKRKFELQLCYELALRRDQKTGGRMEFSWRIDSRGRISELKLLRSTIEDRRMVSCVRQKIASWKFPRPRRGSIKIKYPFSFQQRRG